MKQNVCTVGIDLTKKIFHLVGTDPRGKIVWRKRLTRHALISFMAQLPPVTIGMEACGGAHYRARQLRHQGHQVKLMAPQFVKPYVQSNKNDMRDAEAIAEAVTRPTMRFVPIKDVDQQDIQALHRVRERLIGERTALINEAQGRMRMWTMREPVEVTICTLSVVEDWPRAVPLCQHGAHPPAAPSWHSASGGRTRSHLSHAMSVRSRSIGAPRTRWHGVCFSRRACVQRRGETAHAHRPPGAWDAHGISASTRHAVRMPEQEKRRMRSPRLATLGLSVALLGHAGPPGPGGTGGQRLFPREARDRHHRRCPRPGHAPARRRHHVHRAGETLAARLEGRGSRAMYHGGIYRATGGDLDLEHHL